MECGRVASRWQLDTIRKCPYVRRFVLCFWFLAGKTNTRLNNFESDCQPLRQHLIWSSLNGNCYESDSRLQRLLKCFYRLAPCVGVVVSVSRRVRSSWLVLLVPSQSYRNSFKPTSDNESAQLQEYLIVLIESQSSEWIHLIKLEVW